MNRTPLMALVAMTCIALVPLAQADDNEIVLPGGTYSFDLGGLRDQCVDAPSFGAATPGADIPADDIRTPYIPAYQVLPGFGGTIPGHDEPTHGATFDLGNGEQLVVETPSASVDDKPWSTPAIWVGGYPAQTLLDGSYLSLGSLRLVYPGSSLCFY